MMQKWTTITREKRNECNGRVRFAHRYIQHKREGLESTLGALSLQNVFHNA